MDLNKIPLFGVMLKRLNWLTQRQEVLAQNIANADTPGYRSRDLKAFDFKEVLRTQTRQVNMVRTTDDHLSGQRKRIRDFSEGEDQRSYETAPDGNAVILEEQMVKINETTMNHRLTTELYKKHLGMLRVALGRNNN